MRGPIPNAVVWPVVVVLAALGAIASAGRTFSVFQSGALARPAPALSPFDQANLHRLAELLNMQPGTELYDDTMRQNTRFLEKFNRHPVVTLLHVLPALLFALLAPLQFSGAIRRRHVRWHRWSGRVLVAAAIPIGLSGLVFGLGMPFAGFTESSAIGLFGAVFLLSIGRGFLAIRRGDVTRHREWMIRVLAVALGVSVVRLVGTVIVFALRKGPEAWFGASLWIGFGMASLAGEWWIRRTRTAETPASAPAPVPA